MISACAPYHEEIRAHIKQGYSIAAIHRGLQRLGYPHSLEAVYHYVHKLGIRPGPANQYTMTNRCKQGHEWTEENTGWVRNHGKRVRYCKTCEHARKRRRRAAGWGGG